LVDLLLNQRDPLRRCPATLQFLEAPLRLLLGHLLGRTPDRPGSPQRLLALTEAALERFLALPGRQRLLRVARELDRLAGRDDPHAVLVPEVDLVLERFRFSILTGRARLLL